MEPVAPNDELTRLRTELVAFVLDETTRQLAETPALLDALAGRLTDSAAITRLVSSEAVERVAGMVSDRVASRLEPRLLGVQAVQPAAVEYVLEDDHSRPPVAPNSATERDEKGCDNDQAAPLRIRGWVQGVAALLLLLVGIAIGAMLSYEHILLSPDTINEGNSE